MPDAAGRSFEETLRHLEALVESLEADTPDLDAALDAYEEGTVLARACLRRLEAAEQRVEELSLDA